ncbi:bifunctional phosphoribosyl-AMP cyclohydrolase/phosphoribosyl-ATP diphosphatase HisIE [Rubricoccus marinus]|uniref:Histidine biosynthesis bifunctional protein HisIE n=1 Tax=Rubricoccus marinus TaxID=716817 RepID=A0A259TXL3_9BACT|nr:bifunctional phosphoribosyl-AMP cyclohydrolase/phosphoribosyl-ATP diphosphatase HisIE [Rubricoccus marinus]OZC02314.1 phosphoribosyl-ATP diphosphatase [Rubricoccus marinus]
MIIPSIDLSDGQAVQWRQGRDPVLARSDVFELLERFSLYGEVAVIDLDAATGAGSNADLIRELLATGVPIRVGGGIRDLVTARNWLKDGASRVILGTAAREDWVTKLPKAQVVVALDARGDEWTTHGWQEGSGQQVADLIAPLAERCGAFLYTQVEKEGMMQGVDWDRVEGVVKASPVPVTVAGGITTPEDVARLHRLGADAQIGMAVYTGALDLDDAFVAQVDFAKGDGLVPTVAQDAASGEVLMVAYSNEQSLRDALANRVGTYWSRSRAELWEKGLTSGHRQRLVRVDLDCDGDTLLFQVEQTGHACHLPRRSCFPSQTGPFTLATLDRVLADRMESPPEGSYTAKLFASADLRAEKLREEIEEVLTAPDKDNLRWEVADVIYHLLTHARAEGLTLADIESELGARHGG